MSRPQLPQPPHSPPQLSQPPRIGQLPAGPHDAITDLAGVRVGHATLAPAADPALQTGVTVIHPHRQDPFLHKVPAGVAVINGFGKSVGLVQIEELGQLETPIALTNTFSVPAIAQAQIAQCCAAHPEVGRAWSTVNPLVLECNDGYLNDIQRMALNASHYQAASASASAQMAQGAVGAGRGMSSFQLKGGIGTASRCVRLADGRPYTVGALVLANFGLQAQLLWGGQPLGQQLAEQLPPPPQASAPAEKGSIIMLLASDAPLDARQLKRLAARAGAGLARTGSVYGHGSGDIALAFSTAYTLPHLPSQPMPAVRLVHEALLDPLFQAGADSVEQAIVHALWHAESVTGRDGHQRLCLRDALDAIKT